METVIDIIKRAATKSCLFFLGVVLILTLSFALVAGWFWAVHVIADGIQLLGIDKDLSTLIGLIATTSGVMGVATVIIEELNK